MKKKYCILLIIIGIIGLWLTISHICHFKYPDYFYEANPNINKYIGTNVVSWKADFSYFTYQTIIIFSLWSIFLSIGELFKIKRISNIMKNTNVMTFVLVNYIVTTLLYTVFEFISGHPTFGYYGPYNLSIHNLGTNLIAHYLLFIVCLVSYIKIKPNNNKNIKLACVLITIYLVIYFIYVKITGMYSYNIEWYPYIIFDKESIQLLFSINNNFIGLLIFIATNVTIYSVYMLTYLYINKIKQKKVML